MLTDEPVSRVIKYKRPFHYTKQLNALFNERRFCLVEASTKSGKTHGCINRIVEEALRAKDHHNLWWIAPTYRTTKIAFRRMKRGLRKMIEAGLVRINEGELFIQFSGGGTIWFLSGEQPDNLYGEDVVFAVLDEASRMREEAWFAVFSTLTATNGKAVLIGNVTNRYNWFYLLCRKFDDNLDEEYYCSKLTIVDAVEGGIVERSAMESARKTLPEPIFNALYMAEPDDDGINPFGHENIEACTTDNLSQEQPVVMAWDIGRKIDPTVGIGLDADYHVCKFFTTKADWSIQQRFILDRTFDVVNVVDATGVGDVVYQNLDEQAPGMFVPHLIGSFIKRQQLLENLAIAISQRLVRFPRSVAKQLHAFEMVAYGLGKVRWQVPDGHHDDEVFALAMAVNELGIEHYSWDMSDDITELAI